MKVQQCSNQKKVVFMASRNLEQGILAIQQKQLQEGQRLLKIALRNDPLTPEERVQALAWLAETTSDLELKIQQYQQALQIDPMNQDVNQRLYWAQQTLNSQQQNSNPPASTPSVQGNPTSAWQVGNTPSQEMSPVNPNTNWQTGNTSQGVPPVNPPNPNAWQAGNTPSQGMPPVNPNTNWQTPPQGIPSVHQPNPNAWQAGNTPSQGMPPVNPNTNWQTPPQGIPSVHQPNPNAWQASNTPSQPIQPIDMSQNWQQGFTTSGMPAVNPQNPTQSPVPYGQTVPLQIQQVQRSVGILGGTNGHGTGFFVTRDGLIATSRYIIGGEEGIVIQLLAGQKLEGRVVRSFPEFDLSFVQANVNLSHLMSTIQVPSLPPNIDIIAVSHSGEALRSTIRATRHAIAPHWFPTVINDIPDAGGHPVFDGQNLLIGMLTKNASRSNQYVYGLYIHKIYQCVHLYLQEKQQLVGHNTAYCSACGIISRAPAFGGFFCENCGSTLPYALDVKRFPQPNLGHLYGETTQPPCPNCRSQVGFHNRKCQRCGFEL
jgi:hypothetical protein